MKIVYKIVAAVLALLVIPALLFFGLVHFQVKSVALQLLATLSQSEESARLIAENGGAAPDTIDDTLSFYDIAKMVNEFSGDGEDAEDAESEAAFKEAVDKLKVRFISLAISALLIVVAAVATAVTAIVAKENRKVMYVALGGLVPCVLFKFAFETIAAPFISGEISPATLFNNFLMALIANIEELDLSKSFYVIPALFLAVIAWTVLYNFTLPEEERLARKQRLGELD